jgi:oligopeptide transport system substrate-binding protein
MRNLALPVLALIIACLAPPLKGFGAVSSQIETFRFHMPTEPTSIDPSRFAISDAGYFLPLLYRGLFHYSNSKGLVPFGAKACSVDGLKVRCTLSDRKWSDGSAITSEDYVRGFRLVLGKNAKNTSVELMANVRNALDVNGGKKPETELGVSSDGPRKIVFELMQKDPDFLFKLAAPVFVPLKSTTFADRENSRSAVVNGPYRIDQWTPGRRVHLKANPYFDSDSAKRPDVEVLFVEDEETALNLYDSGELTFMRRLPTTHIAKRRGKPDYSDVTLARFDYFGFGPEMKDQPAFREALSYSLNFPELQKIFSSVGVPGCSNLPVEFMGEEICLKFDLNRAKAAWAKVPETLRNKRYKFVFSKLGGDDHRKAGEWLQDQWRKNLGLKIDLEFAEQGSFLHDLRTSAPPLYRKGLGLDRPTCLAALENFTTSNPENYAKISDPKFDDVVKRLSLGETSQAKTRKLCAQGVHMLLDSNRLIPTGRFAFAVLANPAFTGWRINEMNQLDLVDLRRVQSSPDSTPNRAEKPKVGR